MAYPAGVSIAVLTTGSVSDFFGADAPVIATVTPVLKGTTHLVHAATGAVLVPSPMTFSAGSGEGITASVPHTDQDGWRDGAGNAYKGWYYKVNIAIGKGRGQGMSWDKLVQPILGQALIDLDLVADGQIGVPVSAPTATVTDVLGFTGSVTAEQLEAAGLGGASDPEIAALVQDDTTATGSALASMFATPGQVTTTMANRNAAKDDALRWARFQAGDTTSPLDVVYVGDSTMEGARATAPADRWIDQVTTALRDRYQPAGVNGGPGYRPAMYTGGVPFQPSTWTYWSGASASTLFEDTFTRTGDLAGSKPDTGAHWSTAAGVYTLDGAAAVTQTAGGATAYANVNTAADREVSVQATFGTLDATAQYFILIPFYTSGGDAKLQLEGVVANNRSDWRISQRVAGTTTTIATYATSPVPVDPSGDVVTASIRVEGLTVTATVNGATLTVALTQAAKDALANALHTGFQTPGVGSLTDNYLVSPVVAQPVEVTPTLNAGHGLGLRSVELDAAGEVTEAVTTFTGTGVDIVTTHRVGGGALSVSVDGGGAAAIDTAAAAETAGQKTRIGGLTPGEHTLTITASTGASIVEGVMVYDGDETKGVRQWDAAHVGYNTGSFSADRSWSDSLKAACVPDLAFVALGLNDYKAQIDPATYKTNMEAIIAEVKEANPQVSIVLHNSWERGDVSTPTHTWEQYTQALREIADADPQVYLVDLDGQLRGWNRVDPAYRTIWDADTIHLNNAGYRVVANTVVGEVLA